MMKGLKQGKGHEVEKGLATFQPDPIAIHSPKHSTDHLLATSGNSLLNSSLCRTWCQRSIPAKSIRKSCKQVGMLQLEWDSFYVGLSFSLEKHQLQKCL